MEKQHRIIIEWRIQHEPASGCCLHEQSFCQIFKKDVGITSYEYYQSIKIVKMGDTSLSIAEAFVSCGLIYNGSKVMIFEKCWPDTIQISEVHNGKIAINGRK